MRNFMMLRWRVMVARKELAGHSCDTYVLRWRDTRIHLTETIDGNYEFTVNERPQVGIDGRRLDACEVDVLLAVWCAQDMEEAQQFTLERLRDAAENCIDDAASELISRIEGPLEPLQARRAGGT